jgi:hypothetical protein
MPGYLVLLRRNVVESAATYVEAENVSEATYAALAKVDKTALIWETEKNTACAAVAAAVEEVVPFSAS